MHKLLDDFRVIAMYSMIYIVIYVIYTICNAIYLLLMSWNTYLPSMYALQMLTTMW